MTADEFDTYWPLVSTVYTKIGGVLTQRRGDVLVQNTVPVTKEQEGGKAPPARELRRIQRNNSTAWPLSSPNEDHAYGSSPSNCH